jgi:hypothetical protein
MELRGARRRAEQDAAAAAEAAAEEADAARAQAEEEATIAPPPRQPDGDADATGGASASATGGAGTDDDERHQDQAQAATTDDLDRHEDHNETECGACGAGGELLCCEGCPAAFHAPCAGYASAADVPDAPWLCWFCALQHLPSPRAGPRGTEIFVDDENDGQQGAACHKNQKNLYDDARPENGQGAGERYRRKFGPLVPLAGPFPAGRRLMLASDGACVLYYDVEVIEGGGEHEDHLEVRTAWGRARASPQEPVERVPLDSARWWHGSCDLRRCWTREEWRGLGWRPNARLFALADPAAALLRDRRRRGGQPRIELAAPVRVLPAPQRRGGGSEEGDEEEQVKQHQAKRQKQQAPKLSAQALADLAIIVGGRGGSGGGGGGGSERRGPATTTTPREAEEEEEEQGGAEDAGAGAAKDATTAAAAADPAPPPPSSSSPSPLLAGVPTEPGAVVEVRVPLRLLSPPTPPQQQQQHKQQKQQAQQPPPPPQPPLVLSGWRRATVVRRAPGAPAGEGGARLLVRVAGVRRGGERQRGAPAEADALVWTPAGMRSGANLLPLVRSAPPARNEKTPLALSRGVEVRRTVRRDAEEEREAGDDHYDDDDDPPYYVVDEWVPATVLYAPPEGGWLLVQSARAPEGDGAIWRVERPCGRGGDTVRAAVPVAAVRADGLGGADSTPIGQGRVMGAFASASEAVARAGSGAAVG